MTERKIKMIDLFAGCGGLEDGFMQSGHYIDVAAVEWLKPQVESRDYTMQFVGGKEEKMLQNNYKPMKDRLDSLERQFSKLLSHYGYLNNSYIRGDS